MDYKDNSKNRELLSRLREENASLRTALESSEPGRELIRQSEEFSLLLDFSKLIVSELQLDAVFRLAAEKALDLVQAETVLVPMLNEQRDRYTYMASAGDVPQAVLETSFPVATGMCGWVLQKEQSLLFGEDNQNWLDEATTWERGQQSAVLVPLFGRKRIIGGLSALGKKGGGSFTLHDLDLLTMFANQVSTAIENAALFRQLQEAIDALAAERERLNVTLRSIGDGVIAVDTSKNVVVINKVAEELTGWSQQEALGRPFGEVFRIFNEQTGEPAKNPLDEVLVSGQIIGLANHTILVSRDGTERSIADSAAPIRDAKSAIVGAVLVFRDVTERERTTKELIRIQKIESVGVLAGGIAHDFNNILAAILGNISLAMSDDRMHQTTREYLEEAEKASLRARDLTRQLLTFSKGGAPVREVSSLVEVIKDSANFVLRGTEVTCEFSIPEDLWLVNIDKGQISQVIQNIVLNACQATVGSGTIRIGCHNVSEIDELNHSGERKGEYVKISISDDGIGIPADVIGRIFDPYFSSKKDGSGLGLAICHAIITKHEGQIFATSKPGAGSTFTIYLPASSKARGIGADHVGAAVPGKDKVKILLMDDDQMVRNVAKSMLNMLGHEVVLAADGQEALEIYKSSGETIDLVIMDLTVPGGMGGKEAVRKIMEINPEAKVLVSSGYSNDPVMARFEEYGFCAALIKPYQLNELTKVINHLVRG